MTIAAIGFVAILVFGPPICDATVGAFHMWCARKMGMRFNLRTYKYERLPLLDDFERKETK